MPKWALYYDDGTVFTDSDGSPEESPQWGLVLVIHYIGDSVMPLRGDFFVFRDDRWYSSDLVGLIDTLVHFCDAVKVFRVGRFIDDARFFEIIKKATGKGQWAR